MEKTRFGIIFFLFFFVILFIIARIVSISVFPDKSLLTNVIRDETRGKILDRNGKELAVSTSFFSLYARPQRISNGKRETFYKELLKSGIFTERELKSLYKNLPFVWIKRKISNEEALYLQKWLSELKEKRILKNDELGLRKEEGRFYPYRETSLIVGNVNIDNEGISGLEYDYNDVLKSGYDLHTTIDVELSVICYQELSKGIIENKAESGSVIIIDNQKMEILSIVSYPSYDPNNKIDSPDKLFFPAVSHLFEPGSIMKIFAMAFALESGLVNISTRLYCPGEIFVSVYPFKCFSSHGMVTPEKVIQKSCNVGMIQIADRFNRQDFYNFLKKFRFGEVPELKISASSKGILRNYQEWSILSKYMISIGQEIGVTALQLAIAGSIIANKGVYRKPVLVRGNNDIQNTTRIISERTSSQLLSMMTKVISEEGTAISAEIEGISIAGKTGTGQVAKEKGGGYYKDLYNAVFIGFLPAHNPKYTILVVVHKPRGEAHTGGVIAAPIFSNIVRRMLLIKNFELQ